MKTFTLDAETNGLWGQPFSIAAILYEDGEEVDRFVGRCPIEEETNEWVSENVLPEMEGIEETHDSYESLLADFAEFYLANKEDADIIAHMSVPVESNLLADMHERGLIGDFDGPFPLIDLAGNLQQAGEDPTSVDSYAEKYEIAVDPDDYKGGTHNPLFDSAQAAVVYHHLLSQR